MHKKIYLCIVIFILLGTTACSADHQTTTSQELNFTVGQKDPPSEDLSEIENTIAPNIDDSETADFYRINGSNIYDVGDPLSQDGLHIDQLMVYKSKSLPEDVDMKNFIYFDFGDQTDRSGRLLAGTSYLFLDFRARNDSKTDMTFSWNSTAVFAVDEENYLISEPTLTSWEMRFRSGVDYDNTSKEYFMQTLAPSEEVTMKIGLVVDDQYIDSPNLYFAPAIGLSGELYNKWKVYRLNGKDM